MIARSCTMMLALSALLGAGLAASARAANLTRGGQPAELTVASAGAHSVRVTLKPVGMALPPSPSLLNLEIRKPAISLRTIDKPVTARAGALDELLQSGVLEDVGGDTDDIQKELDQAGTDADVESELAAMKAQIGAGSPPPELTSCETAAGPS